MSTTRRHPRTLEEAFGPYTSHHIDVHREPVPISEKAAGVLLAIAGAAVLAVILFAGLSK
jgi:predicted phage tail protein